MKSCGTEIILPKETVTEETIATSGTRSENNADGGSY